MQPNRYSIDVSYPRITNRKMLVALTVKEWNPRLSFYYPVDNIDNQAVKTHVVWKFAGDANWLIHLSAEADIWQPKSELLNLRNWRFSNEVV